MCSCRYHYIDGEQENRYVAAIKAVGKCVEHFCDHATNAQWLMFF